MNRRTIALTGLGTVVAGFAVAAALLVATHEVPGQPSARHDTIAPPAPPATSAETPDPVVEPAAEPLDTNDFLVTLTVTDKQCFGYGVGCNVTVEPVLDYVHSLDELDGRDFAVTISITGDTSGPVITTINSTADGAQYEVAPQWLTTSGPKAKLSATITEVTEY